uniref:E3 ubiquitin-protein ligase DTX3L-like n=1 Tax=Styela clava TaxID=7725 RepID=UPI001939A04E|nr:E3 ubiquitin-protein ligase DTX3L-like [Styela clava]
MFILQSVSYEAKEFTEYLRRNLFFDHTSIPLLEKAFKAGLLFKIQIIRSSRGEIIWNDEIPHKTNKLGGPDNNGYPDDDHRRKLRAALKAKLNAAGIVYYQ